MTAFVDRKKSKWTLEALKDTVQKVYWTDVIDRPKPSPSLNEEVTSDLTIIGAGFTGLWAALQAKEEFPNKKIIVLEANVVGFGASSRNGGFCYASLTHGLLNGINRWEDEMVLLQKLGKDNLKGIIETVEKYNIDADIEFTGTINIATAEWQVKELKKSVALYEKYGENVTFLEKETIQQEIKSPLNLAGIYLNDSIIMINPAKLVLGLKKACKSLGVMFYENSRVHEIEDKKEQLIVKTSKGAVISLKVISATNAWGRPVKGIRKHVVVIYDHVLMTQPLNEEELASIGWKGRQGLSDFANQFHYYRLTSDNRILWGGWDANYYKKSAIRSDYENRETTFTLLSDHFFEAFPQLENKIKFTHRWAGPIGTTSQFSATFGKKYKGKLAWVAGYTGLGVGASRFGARVALDLLDNVDNERTRLKMVRKKPMPFPPEPFRHFFIQYTKKKIAEADANDGKRGVWLKILDSLGLGFDS